LSGDTFKKEINQPFILLSLFFGYLAHGFHYELHYSGLRRITDTGSYLYVYPSYQAINYHSKTLYFHLLVYFIFNFLVFFVVNTFVEVDINERAEHRAISVPVINAMLNFFLRLPELFVLFSLSYKMFKYSF
jgi:hypothetical protein